MRVKHSLIWFIYKFKNFQSAKEWFYAPEGKDINLFRQAITEGWVTIAPGIDEAQELIDSGYFK